VLKVHLQSQDHPENLANLDDFRTGPAYEYAKRVMMSCSGPPHVLRSVTTSPTPKTTYRRILPCQNAQSFPGDREIHRERAMSRLSVDASQFMKSLCIYTALLLLEFSGIDDGKLS
jgi:hypothetical protein